MTPAPSRDDLVAALCRAETGHVSVSRGALPFIVPVALACTCEVIEIRSDHPTIVHGASRGDIAAVQVEALLFDEAWSVTATGPLSVAPFANEVASAVIGLAGAILSAECLKSGHGHRFDPLLRSGLAPGPQ